MKLTIAAVLLVSALVAKADYWMTFCKTPGGPAVFAGRVCESGCRRVRDDHGGTADGRRVQDAGVVSEDAWRSAKG